MTDMAINLNENDDDAIMAEINMTPLIDIMLVLLIIFMVTSSIALESGLDIDLPETTSQTQAKEGMAVLVSLDAAGAVSVQGLQVEFSQLGESIKNAIKESGSSLVVFEGDRNSFLGRAIEIMDIAKAAGAKKFAIATESKGSR